MAIQFPPVQAGDPEPQDGDTYLYLINQREFVCHRTSTTQTPQWSEIGTINTTSFGYRGGLNIVSAAPNDVNSGNIYSVLDGGTAHISFTGMDQIATICGAMVTKSGRMAGISRS